jgi:hypothetical protein
MDYITALAELGFEAEDGLTRDRVRRAYLRRLKQHPPEKDPDGFKRLRKAFERLKDAFPDEPPPIVATPEVVTAPEVVMQTAEVVAPVATPEPPAPQPRVPTSFAPLPSLAKLEPIRPLPSLLPHLLTLLAGGEAKRAIDEEARWRAGADDFRHVGTLDLARLELVRELLGVAEELPPPVLSALARALQSDDLSLARVELSTFRLTDAKTAGDANVLLFRRAPRIFKEIEGTLFVPTPLASPFLKDIDRILDESRQRLRTHLPRAKPQPSSAGMVYGGLAVVGLLLRLMIGSSSPSYSPPAFRPIEIPKIQMLDYKPEMLFIPPPGPKLMMRGDDPMAQLFESCRVLRTYSIASDGQKQAAALLEEAARKKSCREMRAAFNELKLQPSDGVELHKLYADQHIDAIERRVDDICKKKRGK